MASKSRSQSKAYYRKLYSKPCGLKPWTPEWLARCTPKEFTDAMWAPPPPFVQEEPDIEDGPEDYFEDNALSLQDGPGTPNGAQDGPEAI